jgi:hypothetical protein
VFGRWQWHVFDFFLFLSVWYNEVDLCGNFVIRQRLRFCSNVSSDSIYSCITFDRPNIILVWHTGNRHIIAVIVRPYLILTNSIVISHYNISSMARFYFLFDF